MDATGGVIAEASFGIFFTNDGLLEEEEALPNTFEFAVGVGEEGFIPTTGEAAATEVFTAFAGNFNFPLGASGVAEGIVDAGVLIILFGVADVLSLLLTFNDFVENDAFVGDVVEKFELKDDCDCCFGCICCCGL